MAALGAGSWAGHVAGEGQAPATDEAKYADRGRPWAAREKRTWVRSWRAGGKRAGGGSEKRAGKLEWEKPRSAGGDERGGDPERRAVFICSGCGKAGPSRATHATRDEPDGCYKTGPVTSGCIPKQMLAAFDHPMFAYDASEPSSRRQSPSTSGSNTPSIARAIYANDKVSLPSIGSMFASAPGDDLYESRRNSLPYPGARPVPSGATQWFGLAAHDDRMRSTGSNASTGSPDSPTAHSFTAGSYSSTSTAPTTVKSSPGASPFSDRMSLPAAPSTIGREYPVTIPVPPSDNGLGSAIPSSASPTPAGDSPPATTSTTAQPQRRRGKLPKHVTETLRTWLLSHADHPYPTEEEKKMLCNVTGLTLSQVSNWMINARRRILVPASKQQAALNATTGPYMGMSRSSAAADLARANRGGMAIPHSLPGPLSSLDPYSTTSAAYSLPALSSASDLHLSRGYPSLVTGRSSYGFPGPALHQNYYGSGLPSAPLPNYSTGLIPGGPARYYEHDSFAATH